MTVRWLLMFIAGVVLVGTQWYYLSPNTAAYSRAHVDIITTISTRPSGVPSDATGVQFNMPSCMWTISDWGKVDVCPFPRGTRNYFWHNASALHCLDVCCRDSKCLAVASRSSANQTMCLQLKESAFAIAYSRKGRKGVGKILSNKSWLESLSDRWVMLEKISDNVSHDDLNFSEAPHASCSAVAQIYSHAHIGMELHADVPKRDDMSQRTTDPQVDGKDVSNVKARDGLRAAFCIVGMQRTFTKRIVYGSIKRNLMDAFGAEENKVFWRVKVLGEHPNMSDFSLPLKMMQPTAWRWDHSVADTDDKAEKKILQGPGTIISKNKHTVARNIQQYQGIAECWDMVVKYEQAKDSNTTALFERAPVSAHLGLFYNRTKWMFDVVFKVRSDLVFFRRFPHYSQIDLTLITVVHDFLWLVPRKKGESMFLGLVREETGEATMMKRLDHAKSKEGFQSRCSPWEMAAKEDGQLCLAWHLKFDQTRAWPCLKLVLTVWQQDNAFRGQDNLDVDERIEQWHSQSACGMCAYVPLVPFSMTPGAFAVETSIRLREERLRQGFPVGRRRYPWIRNGDQPMTRQDKKERSKYVQSELQRNRYAYADSQLAGCEASCKSWEADAAETRDVADVIERLRAFNFNDNEH